MEGKLSTFVMQSRCGGSLFYSLNIFFYLSCKPFVYILAQENIYLSICIFIHQMLFLTWKWTWKSWLSTQNAAVVMWLAGLSDDTHSKRIMSRLLGPPGSMRIEVIKIIFNWENTHAHTHVNVKVKVTEQWWQPYSFKLLWQSDNCLKAFSFSWSKLSCLYKKNIQG